MAWAPTIPGASAAANGGEGHPPPRPRQFGARPPPPPAVGGAAPAEGDRAPDAEAALPDVERLDRLAALPEVVLRVREHVVEPAADEAERPRPDRDVGHLAAHAAAGDPPPLT